jgi:hypothetical protein
MAVAFPPTSKTTVSLWASAVIAPLFLMCRAKLVMTPLWDYCVTRRSSVL